MNVCKFLLETSDQAEILQVIRVYYTLYTGNFQSVYSFVSRIRSGGILLHPTVNAILMSLSADIVVWAACSVIIQTQIPELRKKAVQC